jgi:Domain of unknown function (DUF1707)/Domain of unknown function (DUF4190)
VYVYAKRGIAESLGRITWQGSVVGNGFTLWQRSWHRAEDKLLVERHGGEVLVTSDPGPGSNGFPLPPSYGPPSYGGTPYGPTTPVPYGQQQPGYGPYPYGQPRYVQPNMLAAAADRERTIDVLKAAFGEGRLSKEEFDSRSGRVLAARTYADLGALVNDLPAGPAGPVMPYHGYYPQVAPLAPTNGLALGAMICGIAEIFTLGLAAIPAVILGHLARGQIRQTGERMAVAGLVLGYLAIAGWALVILVVAANSGGGGPAGP